MPGLLASLHIIAPNRLEAVRAGALRAADYAGAPVGRRVW
jgi:hypothetical protein